MEDSHIAKRLSEARKNKAMHHANVLGAGAAARRKHLKKPEEKIDVVMREFNRGTLHSGSGPIVKNKDQAIAIALSEARKHGANIPKN